jgi:aminopeptidase N
VPAAVKGAAFPSETLAQYSALMVMKQKYGDEKMKRFLHYELDRYLLSRGTEVRSEQPLDRVEDEPYVYYRKGSVEMYDLQDQIGEDRVDAALAAFDRQFGLQGPPYATGLDLTAALRAQTPADHAGLIEDLFETITLYDNRAVSASATELPDHRYEVTLEIEAKKLRADGLGAEREVPMDDWIDIGALAADGAPLGLRKERVRSGANEFRFTVDRKPDRAGIDPLEKLIDRAPRDNVVKVD